MRLSRLLARASSIIASQAKCSTPSSWPPRSSSTAPNCKQRNQKRCQTRKSKAISTLQQSHGRNVRLRAGIRYQSPTHIDAETDRTLRKADEEVEVRHVNDLPALPPGMRIGLPHYRVYREEVCQSLNMQLNSMKHQLRDYYEEKRQQVEKLRKEMLSATPVPERRANTA